MDLIKLLSTAATVGIVAHAIKKDVDKNCKKDNDENDDEDYSYDY